MTSFFPVPTDYSIIHCNLRALFPDGSESQQHAKKPSRQRAELARSQICSEKDGTVTLGISAMPRPAWSDVRSLSFRRPSSPKHAGGLPAANELL